MYSKLTTLIINLIDKSPNKMMTVQTMLTNVQKNYAVYFYDLKQLICKILERNDFFLKLDAGQGIASQWTISSNYQFLDKSSYSVEAEPQVESETSKSFCKHKQSVLLSYSLKSNQNKIHTGKYSSLSALIIKLILKSSTKMLTFKEIYNIINKHYSFAYFNLKHGIRYSLENLKFFIQVSNEKNIYWTINPEYNFDLLQAGTLAIDKVNANKKEIQICDSLYEKNVQISCDNKSMSLNKLSAITILIITAILKSPDKKLTLSKIADFIDINYDHSCANLKSNVYDISNSFNFIFKSETNLNRLGKQIVYWKLHTDVKFEFKEEVDNSAEDTIVNEDKDLVIRKLIKILLVSNLLKTDDVVNKNQQQDEHLKFIATDRTLEEVILNVEAKASKENTIQFKTIDKNSDLTNILVDLLGGKQLCQKDIIKYLSKKYSERSVVTTLSKNKCFVKVYSNFENSLWRVHPEYEEAMTRYYTNLNAKIICNSKIVMPQEYIEQNPNTLKRQILTENNESVNSKFRCSIALGGFNLANQHNKREL